MEMRPLLHELTAGCRRPCLSPVVRAECGSAGRAQAEGRGVGVGGEAWESGGGGGGGGGVVLVVVMGWWPRMGPDG